MGSDGKGRKLGMRRGYRRAALEPRTMVGWTSPTEDLVRLYFFGNRAPAPTEIPYSWLRPPVRFRPDAPINSAIVNLTGGGNARSRDADSITEFGMTSQTFTLDTAESGAPALLAAFTTSFLATQPSNAPRQRVVQLVFILNARTDPQCWRILDRAEGDRIAITGAPVTWPEGTTSLVITGIAHSISAEARYVAWRTSPVLGRTAGTPGPWFYTDDSITDSTDEAPF